MKFYSGFTESHPIYLNVSKDGFNTGEKHISRLAGNLPTEIRDSGSGVIGVIGFGVDNRISRSPRSAQFPAGSRPALEIGVFRTE